VVENDAPGGKVAEVPIKSTGGKAAAPTGPASGPDEQLRQAAEASGLKLPAGKEYTTDQVRRALEMQSMGLAPAAIELDLAQQEEWNTFIANQPIYYQGALAYVRGHKVPKTNAQAYNYELLGWVDRLDSDAGRAIVAEVTGAPAPVEGK
jgi:hypothetical protein